MAVLGANLLGAGCDTRGFRRKRILVEGSCGARWEPNRAVMCGSQFQHMLFL